MQELTPPEKRIVQVVTDLSLAVGLKMTTARILATIFCDPRELSLEQIAEETGYSLSSVSNATKQLEQLGKIRRIVKPGSKRIYVKFSQDLVQSMHEQFERMFKTIIAPIQDNLPDIIKEMKREAKDAAIDKERQKLLKAKVAWYEDYLGQVEKLNVFFSGLETHLKECHK